MIYNAASFMATPWETIIKVYRQQLNTRHFSTVKNYQEDFIAFLKSKNFYADAEMQYAFLENFATNIINTVVNETAQENISIIDNPTAANREQFLELFENKVENLIQNWMAQPDCCTEYKEYSFEMFQEYSAAVFDKINQSLFLANSINLSEQLFEKIKKLVYAILRT